MESVVTMENSDPSTWDVVHLSSHRMSVTNAEAFQFNGFTLKEMHRSVTGTTMICFQKNNSSEQERAWFQKFIDMFKDTCRHTPLRINNEKLEVWGLLRPFVPFFIHGESVYIGRLDKYASSSHKPMMNITFSLQKILIRGNQERLDLMIKKLEVIEEK